MSDIDYEMTKIVKCKRCSRKELYGEITWYNGSTYCRTCTAERWCLSYNELCATETTQRKDVEEHGHE